MMNALDATSTRPYLIRALYEWCSDNGFTPYVAVHVDETVQVPREYVKNNEIVLNISFDATSSLKLGNEFIEFKARFAGTAREIMVPVSRVIAIYARENGQGMAFPSPQAGTSAAPGGVPLQAATPVPAPGAGTLGAAGTAHPAPADAAPPPGGPRIVQLVTPDSTDDDTEPPKPPSGPRPSLKRVK